MKLLHRSIPVLVTAGLGLVACGGSGDATGSARGGDLRNAEDVRSEQLAKGVAGEIGETIDLDGVSILVSGAGFESGDDNSWLSVDLRVENRTDADIPFLDVGIVCSGNDQTGGWYGNSTLNINAGIPKGTFDEGTVQLSLPSDPDLSEETPECATPAVLRILPTTGVTFGEPKPAIVPLPDDVIAELNAAR